MESTVGRLFYRKIRRHSPLLLAVAYSVFSIATTCIAAILNGGFIEQTQLAYNGVATPVRPLVHNYSTLIDFALLNPLVIYFLRASQISGDYCIKRLKRNEMLPTPLRILVFVLSAVIAVAAMKLYFDGFTNGAYFTVMIRPDLYGKTSLTLTGYTTFCWTVIFMTYLFYRVFEHACFARSILSITKRDIRYSPYHADQSGGFKYIASPCLLFVYAMAGMLCMFIIFILQDKIIYSINESIRHVGLYFYIFIGIPLFLIPILHIHNIMQEHKDGFLKLISELLSIARYDKELTNSKDNMYSCFIYIQAIEAHHNLSRALPAWPLPTRLMVFPIGSMISAGIPILSHIVKNVMA